MVAWSDVPRRSVAKLDGTPSSKEPPPTSADWGGSLGEILTKPRERKEVALIVQGAPETFSPGDGAAQFEVEETLGATTRYANSSPARMS